jgi:WD40 repeat protein
MFNYKNKYLKYKNKYLKLKNQLGGVYNKIATLHGLHGHTNYVSSVVFHPLRSLLASASEDKTAKLWSFSLENNTFICLETLKEHTGYVRTVAFHPTLPILVTGSMDNTVKFWDISDTSVVKCTNTVNIGSAVWSVAFSADGKFLVTVSDHVKLWSISADDASATLTKEIVHNGGLSVAFHPTAPLFATGFFDNTAKLWQYSSDGKEVTCVATLEGHSYWIHSVAFHPKENILATGSRDNTAKLWRFSPNGTTVSCIATLEQNEPIFSVAFHPNKDILAIGSSNTTTKLWNFSFVGETLNFTDLEFLNGHNSDVKSVVFSSDGALLASASDDNTIILWRM